MQHTVSSKTLIKASVSAIVIAAIAIVNNVTLVTHNTREFSRVNGLRIEDWEA